jgi:hypothetical protein
MIYLQPNLIHLPLRAIVYRKRIEIRIGNWGPPWQMITWRKGAVWKACLRVIETKCKTDHFHFLIPAPRLATHSFVEFLPNGRSAMYPRTQCRFFPWETISSKCLMCPTNSTFRFFIISCCSMLYFPALIMCKLEIVREHCTLNEPPSRLLKYRAWRTLAAPA